MDLDESETDEKIYGESQAPTEPFFPHSSSTCLEYFLCSFEGYRFRQALSSLIVGMHFTMFGYALNCRHLFANFWPH